MPIETTLESIDASLKALLIIAQTSKAAPAEVATSKPRDVKVSVKKRDGDTEGTRYSYSAADKSLKISAPGDELPVGHVEISGAEYTKLEAKNAQPPVTSPPTSSPVPTPSVDQDFKKVVDALQKFSRAPGKTRDDVLALLAKFGVATVPALQPLNRHAEVLAAIDAALTPANDMADLGLG